jgi:hypothetical protein
VTRRGRHGDEQDNRHRKTLRLLPMTITSSSSRNARDIRPGRFKGRYGLRNCSQMLLQLNEQGWEIAQLK